ncbi:peroxisome membrane protein [Hyaloraphidium curvatum]|nr:peroxisome membrane protein [Hyaloraphidium curvatum]
MQEFCLMVINIVANFHTAIFSLSGLFAPGKMTPIHTRLQNAFMRAQLSRLGDEPYGALALVFQLFTFVEKFAEIWALKRLGDSGRWNVVVLIEGVKTAIRLACFRLLGFRGPLQPRVVPERDLTLTLPKPPGTVTPPMGPATTNMEASMSMSVSDLALMPSVLSDDEAAELVGVLSGWDRAAEYAFILRPIVYSLLLRRSSAQGTLKTAWTPYLVSLAMDLSSVSVQAWKVFNGNPTWLEEDEMVRRLHLLLYYLLREPVFTLYTKPVLQRFFRYAARRPVVNLLTFILLEYSAYWGRGLYFYSAASS